MKMNEIDSVSSFIVDTTFRSCLWGVYVLPFTLTCLAEAEGDHRPKACLHLRTPESIAFTYTMI